MKRWKVILTAAVLAIAATACSSEKEEEPVKKVADLEIQIDNEKETEQETEQEGEAEQVPEQPRRTQTIALDPGHSGVLKGGKEPLGPGSSEMKAADVSGTSGSTSGLAEYELNLMVGLKLRTELQERGYTVIMTRETNDVPLTNVERAEIANNA